MLVIVLLVVFGIVGSIYAFNVSCKKEANSEAKRVAAASAELDRTLKDRKIICRTQDGEEKVFNNVEEVSAAIGMSVPGVKTHIKSGNTFNWNNTWYQLSLSLTK